MLQRPKMPSYDDIKRPVSSNDKRNRMLISSRLSNKTQRKSESVTNSLMGFNGNKKSLNKYNKNLKKLPDKDEISNLLRQKKLHENKIRMLKKETNNVINEVSEMENISSKRIQSSLVKNKLISSRENFGEESFNIDKALSDLNSKRMSMNRRKSSVFKDVYEVFTNDSSSDFVKAKGFSKTHLFDVYLDKDFRSKRTERLPSIINLYNKAEQLRLIEKYNPTNSSNFEEIMSKSREDMLKNPNPKYDLKSKLLLFGGIKAKKENLIYE
jgi:hypothetical protein